MNAHRIPHGLNCAWCGSLEGDRSATSFVTIAPGHQSTGTTYPACDSHADRLTTQGLASYA